jgi:DnaJ-domain-containing protein 1
MESVGWYPDPTGRYSHRWWDGEEWHSRVFASGAVRDDPLPVSVPSGHKVFCGVCHASIRSIDWTGRCRRCTVPMTSAYIAAKPRREFKAAELVQAAQVTFESSLEEVDRLLAAGEECAALRRLDTSIVFGTVLRAVVSASSSTSKARRAEPLTLGALVELHLQALRLHARFVSVFDPEAFELTLLQRLAAMYVVEGHEDVPDSAGELVRFAAARVEWAESECPAINGVAAHYATAYGWPSLRVALARLGYEFEDPKRAGVGPFAAGEHGRIEAAAVLGIEVDVRPAAIKKAYYREAAKHHPDRLAEAPDHVRLAAEERMKEINAAYELLTA